jgi:hypothetical protein
MMTKKEEDENENLVYKLVVPNQEGGITSTTKLQMERTGERLV